ncbi:MAG: rhodanese-like domain-containing protein [Pseudorhodoferax sp.]
MEGFSGRELLDVFDAAGLRVSAGSACAAARAAPSHVLQAMGLPERQAASAVRMSFGPLADEGFIDAACARIAHVGAALRAARGAGRGRARRARDGRAGRAPGAAGSAAGRWSSTTRQANEQRQQPAAGLAAEQVPLSALAEALPRWCALPAATPVIFVCRSGRRSAQAADALRRQGHANAWSLAGGLAQWTAAA